ncbi:MAG: hypothetical protein J7K89_03295 [Candidatus Cloacimonetes bacterium]|nr:hypothetical protein [Candidatus Cloacimonadota bacterium]
MNKPILPFDMQRDTEINLTRKLRHSHIGQSIFAPSPEAALSLIFSETSAT